MQDDSINIQMMKADKYIKVKININKIEIDRYRYV